MENKSISEIAELSAGEYANCIKLFDQADKAIQKVTKWKEINSNWEKTTRSNPSLVATREQVLYSWRHFIRAVYATVEQENNEERKYQLIESEKHLKRSIVLAYEAALVRMIPEFDYLENSYSVALNSIIPKFLEYKASKVSAEKLLAKNDITINNRNISYHDKVSYHDCDLYEKLVDSLGEGILSLINANNDVKKLSSHLQRKGVWILIIGILIPIIIAVTIELVKASS